MTKLKSPPSPPVAAAKKDESTVVFGESLEKGDFVKTPRALIYIRSFDDPRAKQLKAHHIHLILALAGKKFQKKMIRRYWLWVAEDLGVSIDTARRWAYQLRKVGLLRIIGFTGKKALPRPKGKKITTPGRRHDSNGFDLTPLIELVERAKEDLKKKRELRRQRREAKGGAS